MEIEITVNGDALRANVPVDVTLVEVLRDHWDLTGAKIGCGAGDCGACTVVLDGRVVTSCLVLAVQADGGEVETIEGLADDGRLHPLQQLFEEAAAFQCGFCAPGMIISAKALLEERPNPTEDEIREGLAGNLCRCTGYTRIVAAVQEGVRG